MNFTREGILKEGFVGFHIIESFIRSGYSEVPNKPGNYIVFRSETPEPTFLEKSPAGWFKGKDPTVSIEILWENWIDGAHVLYIGKGINLNKRIKDFIRFGSGKRVGHMGGRLVWQVEGHENFLIAWMAVNTNENPRSKEKQMIREFKAIYGKRPFANLED